MFANDPQNQKIRRVAMASSVGITIGWFDFFIYNLATVLVFNDKFFTGSLKDLMSVLLLYGVGFIARPVGGLLCSHFGDKRSRKSMLFTTLLITGIATFLIGVLPPYAKIGDWAPVALIVLRFAQGLSVGGEWAGAVLLPVEHARSDQRGYYASWTQFGVPAGLFLSNTIFLTLVPWLSNDWGWRVPFLLSLAMVGVALYIRRSLTDAPEFIESKPGKLPLGDVLRHHRKHVVLAMGAKVAENGVFYILTTFVLLFSTKNYEWYAKYERDTLLAALALASLLMIPAMLLYGRLSDRIGRKPVYLFGAIFSAVFAFPFFMMVKSGSPTLLTVALVLGLVLGWAAMYAPQASFFSELFKTRVRYTGTSLAAQVTPVFVGGLAPFISAKLMNLTGSTWPLAVYLIALCVVTIVSVFLAPETLERSIFEDKAVSDRRMPVASGAEANPCPTVMTRLTNVG